MVRPLGSGRTVDLRRREFVTLLSGAAAAGDAAMAPGSTGNAMKGITEWLASIGLSEYAQRFADNAIDLSVIRDLTEQDLKDLSERITARVSQHVSLEFC